MFLLRRLSVLLILTTVMAIASDAPGQDKTDDTMPSVKNTVIVMGMIHSGHRQPGPFDIEHLKELIRQTKPDYVLTEIPPDRLEQAAKQFRETGEITESRVRVFPEYTDALFPLTKELQFQIVPCAAWTTAMNDSRRATLQKAKQTHASQYSEMEAAQSLASKNIAAFVGDSNDPVGIHTQQYDDFVKAGMGPYDRHFNVMIGDGGWTNINAGHYKLIENALNEHSGEGKRFLITFGSWHKYYIKEQLRKRTDINLVSMSKFLQDASPNPWPRFRLNNSGNSAYGSTEIQKPLVEWEYSTGDIIESSPAVVDGIVFVGGHAKRLHAIDQQTGELKWNFDVGGWIRATPSVVNGVVYIGADDNKFYAVDANTGTKLWEFGLGDGGEQSSPAIDDGVVYFGAFDNHIYALDAKTGEQIWKHDVGASMLSSPALTASSLFIGTYAGKMISIDRKTGKENWVFQENEKSIFSSPVANGDLVTFGSYDKHVYALNSIDGTIKWKRKTEGEIFSSPTMVGETIYIGSNDGYLYSLETNSGEVRWKSNLNGAVFSSPAVTDHSIYVGSSDGHMYAVNRKDGSVRWSHLVGKDVKVWTSPVAINGKLYFGSHVGKVVCLKEATDDESK